MKKIPALVMMLVLVSTIFAGCIDTGDVEVVEVDANIDRSMLGDDEVEVVGTFKNTYSSERRLEIKFYLEMESGDEITATDVVTISANQQRPFTHVFEVDADKVDNYGVSLLDHEST